MSDPVTQTRDAHDELGEALKRLLVVDYALSHMRPNLEEDFNQCLQGVDWQLGDILSLLRSAWDNVGDAHGELQRNAVDDGVAEDAQDRLHRFEERGDRLQERVYELESALKWIVRYPGRADDGGDQEAVLADIVAEAESALGRVGGSDHG